jgi:hypothetical protein
MFIDPGGNLEYISCPMCSAEISVVWWQRAMSCAHDNGFTELTVTLPCCSKLSSLNDLQYFWEAGFARFTLEIHDPQQDMATEELAAVARLLGCHLRKIKAHY